MEVKFLTPPGVLYESHLLFMMLINREHHYEFKKDNFSATSLLLGLVLISLLGVWVMLYGRPSYRMWMMYSYMR